MQKRNKTVTRVIKAIEVYDKERVEELFFDLYQKYSRLCLFVSYTILKSVEDANDILQETFLQLFKHILDLEFTNIKSWLVTTAKNLSLNLLRVRKRSLLTEYDMLDEIEDTCCDDGLQDTTMILYHLEKTLTKHEYDIVVKHLLYDMTFNEIGQEMNETTAQISGKYRRAINKFRLTHSVIKN